MHRTAPHSRELCSPHINHTETGRPTYSRLSSLWSHSPPRRHTHLPEQLQGTVQVAQGFTQHQQPIVIQAIPVQVQAPQWFADTESRGQVLTTGIGELTYFQSARGKHARNHSSFGWTGRHTIVRGQSHASEQETLRSRPIVPNWGHCVPWGTCGNVCRHLTHLGSATRISWVERGERCN